jgi:dephospho-CoA kinase
MLIIGITGGTGAGKTSALRALRNLGALTLDCDGIYHEMLASNADMKAELEARFNGVLIDGEINRDKLSGIVFNDSAALRKLNEITHKYVSDEVNRRISEWEMQGGNTVAIDAIALIESGQGKKCDIIVGVAAPVDARVTRIMERDSISREQALLRLNAQQPNEFYIANCDFILENTYDTSTEFETECTQFFRELLSNQHA